MSKQRNVRMATAICVLAAGGLLALLAGATAGQDAPAGPPIFLPVNTSTTASAPSDEATSQPSVPGVRVKTNRPGAFDIDSQDADIRAILRMLSTQGSKNIVASRDVTGKVTMALYDVTFREALEAVLKSNGFTYMEKGNMVYVMTVKQREELELAERQMKVKAFKLYYLTAADAQKLIAPALSAQGSVALTPPTDKGVDQNKTSAGGNTHSSEDVLVVRDYEENIKKIGELLAELDVKPEQVLIEATILKCELSEENQLGINFNVLNGIKIGGSTTKIQTVFPAATGGMTIGFTSSDLTATIQALESITDTMILANPKLLVMNKQRGEVMVGDRKGYLTTTVTDTAQTQTVQFLETGTRLIVRPFIAKDGYIRMEIHPEDSSGDVAILPDGKSSLPQENTTEVTSNVLVRDGHTMIIGGLFRDETKNGKSQVAGLGNIPMVGAAFRSTDDSVKRKEMIILITPHIIRQAVDEAVSEQMKDQVERFRLGNRRNMYWFSRGRISQLHLQWAKEELAKNNIDMALWNVDMAMSINPSFEEAIRLKERITGKALWADDGQLSFTKYVVQRMMMQELGKPVDPIIPPLKPRDAKFVDPEVREVFGMEPLLELPLNTRYNRRISSRPAGNPVPLEDIESTTRPADEPPSGPAILIIPAATTQPASSQPAAIQPAATTQPAVEIPPVFAPQSAATQPADTSAAVSPASQPAKKKTEIPDNES